MKPRVGISRCLLGDEVRYDGTHKRQASLLTAFTDEVEWVPVCPEVEAGMGTPREPIELVVGKDLRLLGVESRRDWTEPMRAWVDERLRALRQLELSGFILKARSPSCGIRDVPIRGAGTGQGMFARALMDALPDLPVADEDDLQTTQAREAFLARVRAYTTTR